MTIITGSGSHSTAGPVLRSAIHTLLVKRGMAFTIERGNGAFKVDALSGRDLHDAPLPTSSKVVTVEQAEFHQMAAARRNNVGGSYGEMMIPYVHMICIQFSILMNTPYMSQLPWHSLRLHFHHRVRLE